MTTVTHEYWMNYLRRGDAQATREVVSKQAIFDTACRVVKLSESVRFYMGVEFHE
jgi:hypothetical protein